MGKRLGLRLFLSAALILGLAACGTWATGGIERPKGADTKALEARTETNPADILVTEEDITDRAYTVLGDIEVTVNKATIFDRDPTRALIDEELREEAAKVGADAVILVRYGTVGIGFASWGSLDGKGRAVAYDD